MKHSHNTQCILSNVAFNSPSFCLSLLSLRLWETVWNLPNLHISSTPTHPQWLHPSTTPGDHRTQDCVTLGPVFPGLLEKASSPAVLLCHLMLSPWGFGSQVSKLGGLHPLLPSQLQVLDFLPGSFLWDLHLTRTLSARLKWDSQQPRH